MCQDPSQTGTGNANTSKPPAAVPSISLTTKTPTTTATSTRPNTATTTSQGGLTGALSGACSAKNIGGAMMGVLGFAGVMNTFWL